MKSLLLLHMMMENQLLVIVDDVLMSPVYARLPPTLASTAIASDKPVEVPVIWDEVARRQVEDVPIPPVDRRVPLLLLHMMIKNQLVVWLMTFPCHLLTPDFHPT